MSRVRPNPILIEDRRKKRRKLSAFDQLVSHMNSPALPPSVASNTAPSKHRSVNVGQLATLQMLAHQFIVKLRQLKTFPSLCAQSTDIIRLLNYLKVHRISEVAKPLEQAIYECIIRNLAGRKDATEKTSYVGLLLDRLANRWQVCYKQKKQLSVHLNGGSLIYSISSEVASRPDM